MAFLDSDDIWMPEKLSLQLAAHAAHASNGDGATLRLCALTLRVRRCVTVRGTGWVPHQGAIFEQLLSIDAAVATPSVLVERRLLDLAGGFDEQQPFFEDYDLWLRLSLLSDVIVINLPLIKIRNHGQHYSADRISVYQARFRLLDKIARHAKTTRLRAMLRTERAKNAASLAFVSAIAGRRVYALQMLWRSRQCAWHSSAWWSKAASTCARVLAPAWLREAVRRHRRNRRALAAAP